MQKTSIEWTDYSCSLLKWREIATGKTVWHCARVSPGCEHCYSETLAHRYGKGGRFAAQDDRLYEPFVDEKEVAALLRLNAKQPGVKVFLNDMTDTFHRSVTDELLDRMFATMEDCSGLIFQVLTKRPERMLDYISPDNPRYTARRVFDITQGTHGKFDCDIYWPLPNVWLGVSAEDQQRADERIPLLLQTPAAVRFVSYEPAIGGVDFTSIDLGAWVLNALTPASPADIWRAAWDPAITGESLADSIEGFEDDGHIYPPGEQRPPGLDWVIVGGESGPGARPFDLEWARQTVQQCREAGVACFVKQMGSHVVHAKR